MPSIGKPKISWSTPSSLQFEISAKSTATLQDLDSARGLTVKLDQAHLLKIETILKEVAAASYMYSKERLQTTQGL